MSNSFQNVPRNPVGRLHRILAALPDSSYGQHASIGQWLISYFGVQNATTATQMELYADLAHLVVAARKTVDEVPGYPNEAKTIFRSHIEKVATAISSLHPQRPAYELKGQVPADTMTGLNMYSIILDSAMPESTLGADKLQELLAEVQTLISDILASDLDVKLKAILLDHLNVVVRAIQLYAISGSAGLQRAAAALEGGSLFAWLNNPDETSKPWLQRCAALGLRMANIIGFLSNTATVLQAAQADAPTLMNFFYHAASHLPHLPPQLPPGP